MRFQLAVRSIADVGGRQHKFFEPLPLEYRQDTELQRFLQRDVENAENSAQP